jgi:hypothetical protein
MELIKMVTLEEFEVLEQCKLNKWEISSIKEHMEYTIDVINRGLNEGRDFYLDGFIHAYWSELSGMKSVCAVIGLSVKTQY